MDSRRDFLKKAALLTAGCGWAGAFPASIQRALAINPDPGTTYLDAEHVVILMQENRSFDHCYGMLRGVRGFNDPRAVTLPNGNPVWLQSNAHGETYPPFRLDLHDSKITWMGSLPHSWSDQVEARNGGRNDRWLPAKPSGHREYAALPLTLGYHTRDDLPFYYALADAFTVCDQNFCSSLTGTTPNRLYLWSGTIREKPSAQAKANVWNSDVDYGSEAKWTTLPERLEDAGIAWRIYQNELSLDTGLGSEEESWLANFTDNPIEWFTQYQVRFSSTFRSNLPQREQELTRTVAELEAIAQRSPAQDKKLRTSRAQLAEARQHLATYTEANYAMLDARTRNLHEKAFTTNAGDPNYRKLTTLTYHDGNTERRMQVPKGDVLHQFRADVRDGKLPAVSWVVAPERFSDHPGSPWYGAWYLSEVLDVLTQNPKVWQKTVFILCYDENDGLFDHIPPFVPPLPARPETGKASASIDPSVEMGLNNAAGQPEPIGLGFRVPLVIASPWSRGGYVCSEVFDHTSIIQFVEKWLTHRTGKPVRETNITAWRRAVCGNLNSVFRPYHGESLPLPNPVEQERLLRSIHQAQFKPVPGGFRKLSAADCAAARENPRSVNWLPRQEPGTRAACALPYELSADGQIAAGSKSLVIEFAASKRLFGERAAGSPFHVYAPGKTRPTGGAGAFETGRTWAFAVEAGDQLHGEWPLADFENDAYHLRVHGPNGFFRELRGTANDPQLAIKLEASGLGQSKAELKLINCGATELNVLIKDLAYGGPERKLLIPAAGSAPSPALSLLDLEKSHGWYDLQITVAGAAEFERRYAGHVENGQESFSDPAMA